MNLPWLQPLVLDPGTHHGIWVDGSGLLSIAETAAGAKCGPTAAKPFSLQSLPRISLPLLLPWTLIILALDCSRGWEFPSQPHRESNSDQNQKCSLPSWHLQPEGEQQKMNIKTTKLDHHREILLSRQTWGFVLFGCFVLLVELPRWR